MNECEIRQVELTLKVKKGFGVKVYKWFKLTALIFTMYTKSDYKWKN